ncbi:hypothetical protein LTR95_005701 [Oleoguttula sp. CCFEE 5521]
MLRYIIAAACLLTTATAQLYLFNTSSLASSTGLTQGCINALTAQVKCDPTLFRYATSKYAGSIDSSILNNTLCAKACVDSLSYNSGLTKTSCSSSTSPWPGLPLWHTINFVWAYQNQTCLKDSSGSWCTNKLAAISAPAGAKSITDLSHDDLCSPCMVAAFKQAQSSGFSSYSNETAKTWSKVQSGMIPSVVRQRKALILCSVFAVPDADQCADTSIE